MGRQVPKIIYDHLRLTKKSVQDGHLGSWDLGQTLNIGSRTLNYKFQRVEPWGNLGRKCFAQMSVNNEKKIEKYGHNFDIE